MGFSDSFAGLYAGQVSADSSSGDEQENQTDRTETPGVMNTDMTEVASNTPEKWEPSPKMSFKKIDM